MTEERREENESRIEHKRELLRQLRAVHIKLIALHEEQKELLDRKEQLLQDIAARTSSFSQWLVEQKRVVHLVQSLHARQIAMLQEERIILQEFRQLTPISEDDGP